MSIGGGGRATSVWPIIYIDLLSQIMIFFVILWSAERRQAEAKQESQQMGLGVGMGTGNRTVRMVSLPGDVLFGSGKTDLGPEG
ncbi:MAG TPA: flagellar motor protein MotB, partial [Kofleriaceae bacterium]|nr:flagellar motor protein MotB [Kofleriaceae bacterium]